MGEVLHIENGEAARYAAELASLRHVSVDEAVTRLLRETVEREREVTARAERMLALGREIRAHMREPASSDHGWLYDENGMPG